MNRAILLAACGAVACGVEVPVQKLTPPAVVDGGFVEAQCALNSDCSLGEECRNGFCVRIAVDVGFVDSGVVADTGTVLVDGGVCVPVSETCNGRDDNCNGVSDEGCPTPQPVQESCNGRDDDNDNQIDEGLDNIGSCVVIQGAVPVQGAIACVGAVIVCRLNCQSSDLCRDNVDNNCNGQVDEGCGSTPAETCNGVDDNANGTIDEGVLCPSGQVCRGTFGCRPVAVVEVCNGVDDDQNGQVDEGNLCDATQSCITGQCRPDRDRDSIVDGSDNCPDVANVNQADGDGDGRGNACDNCPNVANANQADANNNGVGDACEQAETCNGRDDNGNGQVDEGNLCTAAESCITGQCRPDRDHDAIADVSDNCPDIANVNQSDTDGDGRGNVCDNCPLVANPNQADANNNGVGDACEGQEVCNGRDDDSDGQVDEGNLCAATESCITGQCRPDRDHDAIADASDNCPDVANVTQVDGDGDGRGNACDNCPTVANANQADANNNGVGDVCEGQQPPPGTVAITVVCPSNDTTCIEHMWWGSGRELRNQVGTLSANLEVDRCAWGVAINAQQGSLPNRPWYSEAGRLSELTVRINGVVVTGLVGQDPSGHTNLLIGVPLANPTPAQQTLIAQQRQMLGCSP
ncbi:thrombospondin type 3 repeat-containing protein [Candidatus Uhrbacteria bacterium]|nr:thrombospondin type 3 repeat-containing protein [Candidatus Uhrbacteria bacterium]